MPRGCSGMGDGRNQEQGSEGRARLVRKGSGGGECAWDGRKHQRKGWRARQSRARQGCGGGGCLAAGTHEQEEGCRRRVPAGEATETGGLYASWGKGLTLHLGDGDAPEGF